MFNTFSHYYGPCILFVSQSIQAFFTERHCRLHRRGAILLKAFDADVVRKYIFKTVRLNIQNERRTNCLRASEVQL